MKNIVFLLTKDCMSKDSLTVYGNKYWKNKTPNIDELAANGTVYNRHYCVGGSTSMSLTGMLSGHYPYEFTSRKVYTEVKQSEFPSIYDYFQSHGYECHLIWDRFWQKTIWSKIGEFGDESKIIVHSLDIAEYTGSGKANENDVLVDDDEKLNETLNQIFNAINKIDLDKKQFIWMHLPHVLRGRRCYVEDMDAFDKIVGFVREKVGDDSIIISTDHGHMNMHKGKVGYGFDVYEPIINIPLITPRYNNLSKVDYLTANLDIIYACAQRQPLPKREYVICDTQYYWQPKRVIGIVKGKYKYIFNKKDGSEELYDLDFDPEENYNILIERYYDTDRKKTLYYDEHFYYPYRIEALSELNELRRIKIEMYQEQSKKSKLYNGLKKFFPFIDVLIRKIHH